jgi:hypothetical protein
MRSAEEMEQELAAGLYWVAGDRPFLLRLTLRSQPTIVAAIETVLYRYYSHSGSLTLKRGLELRLRIAQDHVLLATELLAQHSAGQTASLLRYWRRREAAVAALHCMVSGRPLSACRFTGQLLARAPSPKEGATHTVG